jgi:hypothetical protein
MFSLRVSERSLLRNSSLTGEFHETEPRDLTHINPSFVQLGMLLKSLFYGYIVFPIPHINKVNDNEATKSN